MTNGPSSATSLHAARHSAEGERTDTDECSSCVSARVDQTSFVPAHTTNSLKGGTGLALGYGLTRPSTDLDITCGSGISKEKVVDVAYALLSRDHNRKITRADVNQKGRGYVRLNWTDHEDGKEIHHETKVDVNVNDDLGGVTNYEIRNEIRVLNIWNIADSKLDTLTGERPREQARDMYDAAWC